jgi:PAS domain S-box-containing protein
MKAGRALSPVATRYAVSIAALLGALALRWLLDPVLGDDLPLVTLFGAVAIAVWIGGVATSVLVAALGYLGATYLFTEPRHTLAYAGTATLVGAAAYLFTCALIIGFCEAMRRAGRRAEVEHQTLRVTFASMGDAVICTDAQARVSSLNPVAESLTGWPRAEAVGQALETVFRIVDERTRAPVDNPARRALSQGTVVGLTNHTLLIRRDGSECAIDDSAAPIRDADGSIVGCVLTFRDITERRRMELELADRLSASHFLASIIRSSQDAIVSKGLDGIIRSWNGAAERMFGYTAADAIGRHISMLIPPERLTEEDEIIGRLRAGGFVDHFETVRLRRSGEPVHVSLTISPIKDDTGRVVGASKIVRDISDRVRTEAQLRSRTERLRLLSEAAGILLSTADAATMLRRLFDKIGPYFGLDSYLNYMVDEGSGSLRLACAAGVSPHTDPDPSEVQFGQAVCGKVALHREPIHAMRIQQSDDPMVQPAKPLGIRAYSCHPLLSDGRLLGTLSFASRTREEFDADELIFFGTICQYLSAAYERLRLLEKLREADLRKDEFLATLAHELRNPLAPLINALEIMKRAQGEPAVLGQALQTMDRQLAQVTRLVEDLLDVSRITRNMIALRRRQVTLAAILHDATEMCRPLADAAGVTVDVSLPETPVVLDADSLRLTQVFANLLNNACKYTPSGGRVCVRAERQGSQVRVSVRDTGEGIPSDRLQAIFNMFSQIEGSLERSRGGLGIGLTLARRLTELHGGTIEAHSEGPGHGSEFVVVLPTVAAQQELPEPPPGDASSHGQSRRVLVVDDNRDSADSLAMLLRMSGHDARVAHDGLEAIAAGARFRPEVVLLDIGLPGLTGYDTCRRMRGEPWGCDITFVAITGWGNDRDRSRSREAGFDHHLVKPIDFGELSELLASTGRNDAHAADRDDACQPRPDVATEASGR